MQKLYQGLGHIAIHTRDMDGSIAFYEKIGGSLSRRETVSTPDGEKQLALVSFAGFLLELIQSPVPVPMGEGNIPHFAVYVDDVDAAAAALQALGGGYLPGAGKDGAAQPLRRAGKPFFHRSLRGADRAFAHALIPVPKERKPGVPRRVRPVFV